MNSEAVKTTGAARLRLVVRLAALACALAALHYGGGWLLEQVEDFYMPLHERYGPLALYAVVAVYVVAMALPFVPGIEISLALLMILGTEGVAVVYFSTLAALCLSFVLGRLIPLRSIARGCAWLQLQRTAALVWRLEPLSPEQRLNLLISAAPVRIVPFLLRHRYLAVALAFNLPGNGLLGGGGGIALVAGLSGLFRPLPYGLMVAVAIAPIPLLVLLQGGG